MNGDRSSKALRVLLVDDHGIVRVGLRNLINDEADLCVTGEAASCADALRQAKASDPDVIVLDLRLPDGLGVDIIGELKRIAPRARMLVLTSFADDTLLLAALKAGADGYLLKDVAEADFVGSIRKLVRSAVVMPPPGSRTPALPWDGGSALHRLTGQEQRVFELVGRGHSNQEVADLTGLTEKTVRNYLSRVFDKLGVTRRSQLVALYVAQGSWRR